MRQIETAHWRRISKAKAKKLYEEGTDILVLPRLVHPENMFGIGVTTSIAYWDHTPWEKFINEFCWYNCQYAEWGTYPAFYERTNND